MGKKGSITVFLALSLTCVFSVFFAFLEAARVSGLKANVQMSTLQAGDGLLASYDRDLWDKYGVLFWKGERSDFPSLSLAGKLQKELVKGNEENVISLGSNYYVLNLQMTDAKVTDYQLATDQGGLPFCHQAAKAMKEKTGELAVNKLIKIWNKQGTGDDSEVLEWEQDASDVLDELKHPAKSSEANESLASDQTAGNQTSGKNTIKVKENPLEWMVEVRKKGIYSLMMPEQEMSSKTVDLSESIENRDLLSGTIETEKSLSVSEKALFRLYLGEYFHSAVDASEDSSLDYEMEYLIGGKKSDSQNMKAVINRLLLMREAANMIYLESDGEKSATVTAVATAITAAVGLPELEPAVKQGVMAAWALAESISDVRILLDGGKVLPVKNKSQWHTSLENLAESVSNSTGKSQKEGLSYTGYLEMLMWTMSDRTLAYRAMDLIEWNTGVQMDQMVSKMNFDYTYEAPKLFWNFVLLGNKDFSSYQFQDSGKWSYIEEDD